jgi:hypothetical protein
MRLSTSSFVAGLLAGSGAVMLVAVALPNLFPARGDRGAAPRAPRAAPNVAPEESRLQAAAAPEPVDASAVPAAPRTATARTAADEIAAIATLRNLVAAQAQFQAAALADEDQDGVGEFGSFAELSGALGVRDGKILNPPVLSSAFKKVARGSVERNGYRYRIYLPQTGGQPVGERDKGGIGSREVDPDVAETAWCCYAWPADGEGRTFFTNEKGDVLLTEDGAYSGDRAPPPYAAYRSASGLTVPTAIEDVDARGADRWVWKPVG